VTEVATESLAARRARARARRSAVFGTAIGQAGPAGADQGELVVLLPSADVATVLLLCEQAAELSG